jgi:hypothetical protein
VDSNITAKLIEGRREIDNHKTHEKHKNSQKNNEFKFKFCSLNWIFFVCFVVGDFSIRAPGSCARRTRWI